MGFDIVSLPNSTAFWELWRVQPISHASASLWLCSFSGRSGPLNISGTCLPSLWNSTLGCSLFLWLSLSPLGILEPLRSLFCRWRNQPRFKDLFKVSQPRNGGRILGQEYGQGFSHGLHTFQGMLVFFIPFFPLSVAVFPSFLERHVLSRIRGRVPRDKLLSCWA